MTSARCAHTFPHDGDDPTDHCTSCGISWGEYNEAIERVLAEPREPTDEPLGPLDGDEPAATVGG